jgi:DNA-binding MarR family transcriptional regulator
MSTKKTPFAPPSDPVNVTALDAFIDLFESIKARMGSALRDTGDTLTPMAMRLLSHCLAHPGASQQTLVERSARDKGQVARLIKELDKQGMLVRADSPDDKRSYQLQVTPAGRAACERFRQHHTAIAAELFAGMAGPDVAQFTQQLQRLSTQLPRTRTLSVEANPPPPPAPAGRAAA